MKLSRILVVLAVLVVGLCGLSRAKPMKPPVSLSSFKVVPVEQSSGTIKVELCFLANENGFLVVPINSQGNYPMVEAREGRAPVWHLEVVGSSILRENGRHEEYSYQLLPVDADSTYTLSLKHQAVKPPSECFVEAPTPQMPVPSSVAELRTGFLSAARWERLRPRVGDLVSKTEPFTFEGLIAPIIREEQSVDSWVLSGLVPTKDVP